MNNELKASLKPITIPKPYSVHRLLQKRKGYIFYLQWLHSPSSSFIQSSVTILRIFVLVMHTTSSSKKFFGCPSFTELVQKGVANLEAFVFNYIAPRNPNFIYFLKSCILFFFGTFIPGYVFMVVEGKFLFLFVIF